MSSVQKQDYLEGYRDAVLVIQDTMIGANRKNGGGRTASDMVGVYNDIVGGVHNQLREVNMFLEQVVKEDKVLSTNRISFYFDEEE